MRWVGLLLAAGAGERLAGDVPKAFVPLAGRPLLVHALARMRRGPGAGGVVVVLPPGLLDEGAALTSGYGVLAVVEGGSTRQESVRRGLDAVPAGVPLIVCHDAARPMASSRLFERVLSALDDPTVDGAVPVLPSVDTVKRIRDGVIVETVPREEVGLAQTPQAFRSDPLRDAHRLAVERGVRATDDAMLLEAAGYRVVAVPGEDGNFKITAPEDLERAELVLGPRGGRGVG